MNGERPAGDFCSFLYSTTDVGMKVGELSQHRNFVIFLLVIIGMRRINSNKVLYFSSNNVPLALQFVRIRQNRRSLALPIHELHELWIVQQALSWDQKSIRAQPRW